MVGAGAREGVQKAANIGRPWTGPVVGRMPLSFGGPLNRSTPAPHLTRI